MTTCFRNAQAVPRRHPPRQERLRWSALADRQARRHAATIESRGTACSNVCVYGCVGAPTHRGSQPRFDDPTGLHHGNMIGEILDDADSGRVGSSCQGSYQAMRWSNSSGGGGGVDRSAEGIESSSAASTAAHSGGPRAWAMVGGVLGSPRWRRMSRPAGISFGHTTAAAVMKAMMRISPPHLGHRSGNTA